MYHVPNELIDIFAGLIDDKLTIKYMAERAAMPMGMLDLSGPPKVLWLKVLQEARKQEMLEAVLDAVAADYPRLNWNAIRDVANNAGASDNVSAPSLGDGDWHSRISQDQLEKITGNQPTFLPLHFFEVGQQKAASVALIQLPNAAGTGFLIEGNLLLTNNHVIGDIAAAESASIVFNFHKQLDGSQAKTTSYSLDPKSCFATSDTHDWTVVGIDAAASSTWGAIELRECTVNDGEYVNIIQHPMGGPKVVAMYHNVVVFSDEDRVQYLTDTLPGSSGSPVFNSEWSLVGLHHAGGPIAKDGSVRNQGISVRRIIDDLKSNGLI